MWSLLHEDKDSKRVRNVLLVAPRPVCLGRHSTAVCLGPAGTDMVYVLRTVGLPAVLIVVEIRTCKHRGRAVQSGRSSMAMLHLPTAAL